MLHTDLTSIQPTSNSSSRSVTPMPTDRLSSPAVIDSLKQGMEDLIIETKLRSEEGFLKTAWESAVARGVERELSLERERLAAEKEAAANAKAEETEEDRATTPISTRPSSSHGGFNTPGRPLPSPRPTPSPPPSSSRYRPAYQRQRSVSLY